MCYGVSEEQIKNLGEEYKVEQNAIKIFLDDILKARELILTHPEIFVDYEVIKGKMDDVFLSATGKRLEGENNAKS